MFLFFPKHSGLGTKIYPLFVLFFQVTLPPCQSCFVSGYNQQVSANYNYFYLESSFSMTRQAVEFAASSRNVWMNLSGILSGLNVITQCHVITLYIPHWPWAWVRIYKARLRYIMMYAILQYPGLNICVYYTASEKTHCYSSQTQIHMKII